MSYLKIALALASASVVFAQGNQRDRMIPAPTEQQVERSIVSGNEKTIGAANENNTVRSSGDENTVGNAKTVGAKLELRPEPGNGIGTVGNSKTVGGN